ANYLVDESWQNTIERECLKTFISLVPQYLRSKIVIVGDRGFGKVGFIKFLKGLGVNFVIRVKGDVWVRYGKFSGCLKRVRFSDRKILWWCKVCYQKKEQEPVNLLLKYERDDPLYIVTNLSDSSVVLEIYGHRMRIEESFRDFKNERYFSLRAAGLKGVVKMEKLILVTVVAYMFVILFGAVSEGIKEFVDLVSMVKNGKKKLLSSFRLGLELLDKLDLSKYPWLFCFKKLCPTED
ncbi:MAG: transposase, partial [candidate division WOR-3 bacterium]